jgi:hypothetical protein
MALDSGPCLSDLPGIPFLRAIEAFWLSAPVLLIFVVTGAMLLCIVQHTMSVAIVIFYALLYFVIFAPRRTFVKLLIVVILIGTVQAFLEQEHPGWHPSDVLSDKVIK